MVFTTPSTAATIPKAFFVVVGFDLAVHERFDLVGVEVARDHHAQVVGDELHHVVVGADGGVFFENLGLLGFFDVFFNRHQPFFAGFLEDVEHQRHELHVARLGVFAALEAGTQARHGLLDHLHLVVGQEGAHSGAPDGQHFPGEGLQDYTDVSAVDDEHPEDTAETH
jgi:hypothetical protein